MSICPGGVPTGYTYFIPQEEHLESRVVTRSYMEAKMVVALAGRCAEKLILGDASIGRAPAVQVIKQGIRVPQEMLHCCSFLRRMGRAALMSITELLAEWSVDEVLGGLAGALRS